MDKIELKLNSYGKNDFAAQKIVRSGLIIYVTTMNINSIVSMMPEIDPKIRAANNRFVDEKHADSFGKYWIDNPNSWVSPPISITSTGSFDYESIGDITGTENSIGVLRLPVSLKSLVEILDGQHRILGFRLAEKKIISEKKKIENELIDMKKQRQDNPKDFNIQSQIANLEEKHKKVNFDYERLNSESVTVEIYSMISSTLQKKFFVTVANNAQGINKSVTTLLDDTKTSVITRNLATKDIVLSKITNTDTSKKKKKNEVLKLEDVSNIVKILLFGYENSKKISNAMDKVVDLQSGTKAVQGFWDMLQSSLVEFKTIAATSKTDQLSLENNMKIFKTSSIAFSTPLLRALAHAYHKNIITINKGVYTVNQVPLQQFSSNIQAFNLNIVNGKLDQFWYLTGHAQIGKKMLESKNQDLTGLSNKMADLLNSNNLSVRLTDGKNAKIANSKIVIT